MTVHPPTIPISLQKPIILLLASFMGGLLFGRFVQPPVLPLIVLFLLLAGVSVLLYRIRSQAVVPVLWALVFVLGVMYLMLAYYPRSTDIVYAAGEPVNVDVVGKVLSTATYSEDGKRRHYVMEVERVIACSPPIHRGAFSTQGMSGFEDDARVFSGKVYVTSFQSAPLPRVGDMVRIQGRLLRPQLYEEGRPMGMNWVSYLTHQGIWTQLYAHGAHILVQARPPFYQRWSSDITVRVASILERSLSRRSSSVVEAMVLGLHERLPADIVAAFRATGTAHVLVVSGLHVGLVLLGMFLLARVFGLSIRTALLIALPVMLAYAYVTGMRIPALRASLMACIGVGTYLVDRRIRGVVVVCLAAFIILLVSPLALFSVSFQLSFVTVAGIVHLTPYFMQRFRFVPAPIRSVLCVSTAAQLSILPLLALHFGQLPLVGFFSNLIVVPLMSLLVLLSFVGIGFGFVIPAISWPILGLVELVARGLTGVVVGFSAFMPHLSPAVAITPVWVLPVYYGLLIVLPMTLRNEAFPANKPTDMPGGWLPALRLPWL